MGRVNKTIAGIFTNIVGTENKISSYDMFIGNGFKTPNKELNSLVKTYKDLTAKHTPEFEKLAAMEVLIMQLRTKENITDVRLSVVREYIYARCPFYRNDKTAKDIRVIVGTVTDDGSDLKKLLGNKTFIAKAKAKLASAMNTEIKENLKQLKTK